MLIIATLYGLLAWLVFRFRLLPWNWPWRIVTVLVGVAILTFFVGLLNYLTPSGRIVVVSRVLEVTPNVAGQVTTIAAERNALLKAGATLFEIDRSPYDFKVRQLKAALVDAKQKAEQLKGHVDLAEADVGAARAQVALTGQRRTDLERLARTDAASQFRVQDATTQAQLATAQLQAAQARGTNARLALEAD